VSEWIARPSSLPTWSDCSRRTAAKLWPDLIEGAGYSLRRLAPSVGAPIGSGVHAGASVTLKAKLETGDIGPDDVAEQAALEEFDARAQADGVLYDSTTQNRNHAQRQIVRMTGSFRQEIAPQITPTLVEERVEASFFGMVVSGQADNLAVEGRRLRDLKTGIMRRPNGPQYGGYSLLYRAHGYEIEQIVEDHIPRVSISKEQPPAESHIIPVDAAETEAYAILMDMRASIDEFIRLLREGGAPAYTAFRANPMSALCSDRYCPAWGTDFCRSHLGAR
jgi:hypothetical protein